MRDLVIFVAGVAITLVVGLLTVLPKSRDVFDRRRHVRDVQARLEPIWQPLGSQSRVLRGVRLVVHNYGKWPVREVIALEPACVLARDQAEVVPNQSWVVDLFLDDAARRQYEEPVTLQLVDVRGRMWRWTYMTNELRAVPESIPPHARFIQWTARRFWTSGMHERFIHLSKSWQRRLWGYNPEGREAGVAD